MEKINKMRQITVVITPELRPLDIFMRVEPNLFLSIKRLMSSSTEREKLSKKEIVKF